MWLTNTSVFNAQGQSMSKKYLTTSLANVDRRTLIRGGSALLLGSMAGGYSLNGQAAGRDALSASNLGTNAPTVGPNLTPPVIEVRSGRIRGFLEDKIYTFRGIPYAVAERFELPKAVPAWAGIKDAQYYGAVCPIPAQANPWPADFVLPHRLWPESENCQNLNVWTPTVDRNAKKPVMVWMHGGGYTNGSSIEGYAYDGRNLSEFGDVVVVTVNHRLNILGTLDLSEYGEQFAKSRYTGTADLVAALQWVRDNIETFGGNPANVMIFGQSGGGGKVLRMMHTPAAKGLFNRVAAQSGSGAYDKNTDTAKDIKLQRQIAAYTIAELGLKGNQISELKKISYNQLIAAGTAALTKTASEVGRANLGWGVIADNDYVMVDYCDWAASIPLIAGYNFSEQQSTANKSEYNKSEWTATHTNEVLTKAFGSKKDEVVAEFKKVFPEKKAEDIYFFAPQTRPTVRRALDQKLETAKAPVYNYLFSYEASVNGGTTAFHCAEIPFVFHNIGIREIRIATGGTASAFALQDKVAQSWVSFARTGNPSQPGLEWKPYKAADPQAMIFDVKSGSRVLNDDKLVALMTANPTTSAT
jgi:para-nitrobenzyl esterase